MHELKFILYSDCIPVKGASRSTICDVQRANLKFIPNSLCELLLTNNGKSLNELVAIYGKDHRETIEEYMAFLIENEFGFWTETPELFMDMDKAWYNPNSITNGIIDIAEDSRHEFESIFVQYSALGCEHLQIRCFDIFEISFLRNALVHIANKRIQSIELILKYSESIQVNDYKELVESNPYISRISIHSSPFQKQILEYPFNEMADLAYFTDPIDSSSHCGIIAKEYFEINREMYLESVNFNSCLNRKISIDVDGEIKNCPSLTKSYGNINTHSLSEVVGLPDFKQIWSVTKDQIKVCKDCEFRYVCTDCRAFLPDDYDKPAKCNYDPYKMVWEE